MLTRVAVPYFVNTDPAPRGLPRYIYPFRIKRNNSKLNRNTAKCMISKKWKIVKDLTMTRPLRLLKIGSTYPPEISLRNHVSPDAHSLV